MKVNVEPDHETDDDGLAVNVKTKRVLKQETKRCRDLHHGFL